MIQSQSFLDYSCKDFTEALASKQPIPGGGGASALVGSLGAALGHMVCALTVGKEKYAGVEVEITSLMKEISERKERLLHLIDKDGEVFEALAEAYKNPEDKDGMEECLLAAALVPMEIMKCCGESLPLVEKITKIGNKMAVSDGGASALFFIAAVKGASLNVFINTSMMKDKIVARELTKNTEDMIIEYEFMVEKIFYEVKKQLTGA